MKEQEYLKRKMECFNCKEEVYFEIIKRITGRHYAVKCSNCEWKWWLKGENHNLPVSSSIYD